MKVVFCFTKIFRNSHREIFDLDGLIQKGYEVVLLDLTAMHGGNPTCTDDLMLSLRKRCTNRNELEKFVQENSDLPIIYITNDVYLTRAHSSFSKLVKPKDRILGFRTKTIPCQHTPPKGLTGTIISRIQNAGLDLSFVKSIYIKKIKYFPPNYYLCNTLYNLPIKANLTVRNDNILIVHSDDVNKIIKSEGNLINKQNSALFIDQLIPFAHKSKVQKNYFTEYYNKIEEHLHKIKEAFGLDDIRIAQHPESAVYSDELESTYKGFTKVVGDTLAEIKKADFVIAHYSTAIGFAVYLQKPIILLTDDILKNINRVNDCTESFKNILGLNQINMDENPDYKNIDITVDEIKYKNYITKYMKDSVISENSYHYAVEVIANDLKNN